MPNTTKCSPRTPKTPNTHHFTRKAEEMFQDDYPEDLDNIPTRPPASRPQVPPGTFRMVSVTPHSVDLVDTTIDRSADFDRALKEGSDNALEAYGDLVQAKGKLVCYIARLMDMANDRSLNAQRTSKVRFT